MHTFPQYPDWTQSFAHRGQNLQPSLDIKCSCFESPQSAQCLQCLQLSHMKQQSFDFFPFPEQCEAEAGCESNGSSLTSFVSNGLYFVSLPLARSSSSVSTRKCSPPKLPGNSRRRRRNTKIISETLCLLFLQIESGFKSPEMCSFAHASGKTPPSFSTRGN